MTATSRPLRKDAARNRELLIKSAREVFADRGLEASLDDVAHHAGLGVGTAYRHFANKHELAKAIFAEAIDAVVALAEESTTLEPRAGIVAFLEGTAERQTADRGLREVMTGVHDAEQMDRINDRLSASLNTLVSRAKATGDVRSDVEASDLGVVLMMLCTVADVTGEVAPDHWRRYLPMLLDGLRSGDAPAVPPISEGDLREALSSHKQRLARATAG